MPVVENRHFGLDQPGKGNFIVSKFEYSKCIGSRPVILKIITMEIPSEWFLYFYGPDYLHV